MPGYQTSINQTGNAGFQADLNFTKLRRDSTITAIRDWALTHGWSQPSPPGSTAETTLVALAIPFRGNPDDPFSQVPPNARFFGVFETFLFQLWDPNSTLGGPFGTGDVDPSGENDGEGHIIVGVELGLSPSETMNNFNGKATANTRYLFDVFVDDGTGNGSGPVIAKGEGPSFNDPDWEPNAANIFGVSPRLGGWYLNSTPAPVTGDTITLWVYAEAALKLAVQTSLNGNVALDCDFQEMMYYGHINPHQVSFQKKPGQVPAIGDGAQFTYLLASSLCVPEEFGPKTRDVLHVDATLGQDLVIQTVVDHGFEAGTKVRISLVTGTTVVNGLWWIIDVPEPDKLTISEDQDGDPLQGDGSLDGDPVTGVVEGDGIFSATFAAGQMANSPYSRDRMTTAVNGIVASDPFTSDSPEILGVSFPLLNIGTQNVDALTSVGKAVIQSPYVQLCVEDNTEGRIAGFLWDSYIGLQKHDYGQQVTVLDKFFLNWLEDTNVLRVAECSLWVNAQPG